MIKHILHIHPFLRNHSLLSHCQCIGHVARHSAHAVADVCLTRIQHSVCAQAAVSAASEVAFSGHRILSGQKILLRPGYPLFEKVAAKNSNGLSDPGQAGRYADTVSRTQKLPYNLHVYRWHHNRCGCHCCPYPDSTPYEASYQMRYMLSESQVTAHQKYFHRN